MLNRLMFVYFIQRKGFLDNDPDYLKNRLQQCSSARARASSTPSTVTSCCGCSTKALRSSQPSVLPDLEDLLGEVPYLNGGLFELHTLEQKHTDIDIPDEAFEHLFAFFDQYDWHLDTRPLRSGPRNQSRRARLHLREVHQPEADGGLLHQGGYHRVHLPRTPIIPYLFDAAQKKCAIAFQPDSALWRLLRDDPDRYIYEPVRKGVDAAVCPQEIARGVDDVSQRGGWNRPAAPAFALPTETWREHVARRQRCLELRDKLRPGKSIRSMT